MSGPRQRVSDYLAPPQDSERYLFFGTLLQWAIRAILIVFVIITLLLHPPTSNRWICVFILAAYVVIVGCGASGHCGLRSAQLCTPKSL